jgi:C4-dicarboxylate-specific signal transduction histidine kinase
MDDCHVPMAARESAGIADFFSRLLETDFVPRSQCMLQRSEVIWLHVFSDSLITLAYYSIPLALIYFWYRRRDLAFNWIFVLFSAFILACGTTHLMSVVAIWQPFYRLDGVIKLATGLVSIGTAIILWPLVPKALALPSPGQLQRANLELESEIEQRRTAQADLRQAHDELEIRVQQRTAELAETNRRLEAEITQRRDAETELARHRDRLEELVTQRTEALRQSLEQLRRSERLASLGTLAAGIAHEINNPLNAMLVAAQYARQASEPEEVREALDSIIEEGQRGGQIIRGILKFARADEPVRTPGDLNQAVRHAAELSSTYLEGHQLRLELELAEDLPPVLMNTIEIEQVIVNLIKNAVEAGGGHAHVTLSSAARNGHVVVTIHDDGPGIPPDVAARIFDPFFTTKLGKGGTGLGLSICHGIVSEHGGTISVLSQPGAGTTFTINLPAAEDESAAR